MDTYRGKIIHVIIRILIYSSFCVLNLMLLTSRPNFVEVVHTIWKVEEAWIKVSQDHSANKNPKLINRSYNFWNCVSWRVRVMSLTQIAKVWGSLGAGKQRLLQTFSSLYTVEFRIYRRIPCIWCKLCSENKKGNYAITLTNQKTNSV
jgi:hypothetical protein